MGILEQLKKLDGFYTKVLESMESKKKSPYELDLEVMDRKPDITPKDGDWVKIKSKEWYEKWKDSSGDVPVCRYFTKDMKEHCGRIYQIKTISLNEYIHLDEVGYLWSMEMFEQVYPQEEYIVQKTSFGYIVTPISKGPTAMEAIQSEKEQFLSDILHDMTATIPTTDELTKSLTGCKLDSSLLFPALPKQSMQAYIKPETKLRIIKTNQLIKIEKL